MHSAVSTGLAPKTPPLLLLLLRDSKGAVNLGGCYAFLESVFGLGSCPYSRADKVQAAVWDLSRTAGDMDWLWPQAQELNEQGIVCYLARKSALMEVSSHTSAHTDRICKCICWCCYCCCCSSASNHISTSRCQCH